MYQTDFSTYKKFISDYEFELLPYHDKIKYITYKGRELQNYLNNPMSYTKLKLEENE